MPKTLLRPPTMTAIVNTALLVAAVSAFGDVAGRRCAVITNQHADGPAEIVADLLAAKLTKNDYTVVDRAHLDQVLAEHTLAQAFSTSETATRRNICNIAGADLLVLLSGRAKEGQQLLEWSVASMPSGLRLASGVASWDEHRAEKILDALLGSVRRADRLSQTADLQLVCVPSFHCRNPTFDHSGRQVSLAKLTEELLLKTPNVAVVALAEVDALTLETQLTGAEVARHVPLTIVGSFETTRTESGLRTTLEIELRAASTSRGVRRIVDVDDARIMSAISDALADLLKTHAGVQMNTAGGVEAAALTEQALAFIAVGELDDAIPLLKTAILLKPDNLETRMRLFWTWNGLSTDMVRLRDRSKLDYRLQMLENTLDVFDEIARRRLVTKKDLDALHQTRGHGHLYGANKRTYPKEVARYIAYCARYRDTLRRIVDERYGSDEVKTRDRALQMLIIRLGADRYDAPAQVHGEMLALIRELAGQRGSEVQVLNVLLTAKPRAACSKPEDVRFWNECCSPDEAGLAELASLAASIRGPHEAINEEQFEKALEHAAKTLELSEENISRIRKIAQPRLRHADIKSRQQAVSPLTVMPLVERLTEIPSGRVRSWLTEPDGMEFMATEAAVYRITPQRTFELIRKVNRASLAWDTKYLWLATDELVEVIESNGDLVTRLEVNATKYLTPIAAGKMFIARHDLNEHGGRRAAHEVWTLGSGDTPKLKNELLYVSDRNWTFGVRSEKSPRDLEWHSLTHGHLFSDAVKGDRLLFFQGSRLISMDPDSHKFRIADGRWPQGAYGVDHAGAYYLIAGYGEDNKRSRAIFRADHPDREPQLIVDLGWLRYHGDLPTFFRSGTATTVVNNGWLHIIFSYNDSPPQWMAVNLKTYDVRALAIDISHLSREINSMSAHFIASQHFGLLLRSHGKLFRVELPPEETWQSYWEVVEDLRLPKSEIPRDPWHYWREGKSDRPISEKERRLRGLRRPVAR